MKSPVKPTAVLVENAVDLMFEIYLLRGDCSAAAKALMARPRPDDAAVEECAHLDDTLAKAYRLLQKAVRNIQASRGRRKNRTM
jgi:hypothetical protein